MKLINIAVSSLKRQFSKRIFLIISIVLGSATIIGLFTFVGTQKKNIEMKFDEYGANILILPKSDNLSLSYGGITVSGITSDTKEISMQEVKQIWEIPNKKNIRAVSPKLLAVADFDGLFATQALLVGVLFAEEKKIKNWWQINGRFPDRENEILIGSQVAAKLNLKPEDTVSIEGSRMTVSGILLPTGSQDDTILFADYNFVSRKFSKEGKVSLVEASALCSDCPIEEITKQISLSMPNASVSTVRQVMVQKLATINQFEQFAFTLTLVIACIGGILIFTSMMGAVAERKHEIGIFRAIGYKKKHIISIILSEALILTTIAAVLGILGGLFLSTVILPGLQDIKDMSIEIDYLFIAFIFFATLLIGLGATIYPAYKASLVDPITTLNSL